MNIRRVVENTLVPHSAFNTAKARLKQCLANSKDSPEPIGLALLGESRTGKSRVLEEAQMEMTSTRDRKGAVVPILRVSVPSSPTVVGLSEEMLKELGDPKWEKGTRSRKSLRLHDLMRDCGVQMLMLDEFQHFVDKQSHLVYHDVTDWLKVLADKTRVALVVAGLKSCEAVLLQNEQLSGRFQTPVFMPRFNWAIPDHRAEFCGILGAFTESLSEEFDLPALDSDEMAFRMWCATGGLMGYVTKLLRTAVWDALDSKNRSLTLDKLQAAYVASVWTATEVPVVAQPFSAGFSVIPSPDLISRVLTIGVRHEPGDIPPPQRGRSKAPRQSLSRVLTATGA
ncbi:TniB family NTP-binding protein [Piscinibacter sp.]|jgi:hypothetical protein|uniref:TniB family NTP-binding protein n=1 Tax=Piscinibacter sp. TaxID=1903157 RepID=UPI001DAB155F|nr:TniB family NTP-binding protein [Piscinibacter sp.]MBK7532295.1 TniB family NTP-binding protein [Piscinibacter sp.]